VTDRDRLDAFLTAINTSPTTLDRPVCRGWVGDWQITGKNGHILAAQPGYLLYFTVEEKSKDDREPSSRPWENAKVKLSFCGVTYAHEAEAIREVLGIRKRRLMTPEALSRLERARGSIKSPKLAPDIAPEPEEVSPGGDYGSGSQNAD
jgi:hypothetical protein